MKLNKATAVVAGVLALAIVLPAADAGGGVPQGMPAGELLQHAPRDTQAVIAVDATRLPEVLYEKAEMEDEPIGPRDVKQVVAFIGWNPQMMGAMGGEERPDVPFSAIVTHEADPAAMKQYAAEEGTSEGTVAGMETYRVEKQGRSDFTAVAGDGSVLVASSPDRLSSLIRSYSDGQGGGLPDNIASILRPDDQSAVVAGFAVPQQVAALAKQNPAMPPLLGKLNGVSISLGFPGEELAARAVGLFSSPQGANQAMQMVQGMLQGMKQSGGSVMPPGGQGKEGGAPGFGQAGGSAAADLLDKLDISTSGSEMTIALQMPTAELRSTVESSIKAQMSPLGENGNQPGTEDGSPFGEGNGESFGEGNGDPFGGGDGSPFGEDGGDPFAEAGPDADQQDQGQDQQEAQAESGSQAAPAATGETIATASREKKGVTVQVSLVRGDWFMEERVLVETRVSNQGSQKRLVSYGYEMTGSGGEAVGDSGGAAELEPGESTTFSSPAVDKSKESQVSGVSVSYLDILPMEEQQED